MNLFIFFLTQRHESTFLYCKKKAHLIGVPGNVLEDFFRNGTSASLMSLPISGSLSPTLSVVLCESIFVFGCPTKERRIHLLLGLAKWHQLVFRSVFWLIWFIN